MADRLERDFQAKLIKELRNTYNQAIVMPMDGSYIQGFPDVLILYKDKWATLECKRSSAAPKRPNQETYNSILNSMSFSRFVYPENKEEVLNELDRFFSNV